MRQAVESHEAVWKRFAARQGGWLRADDVPWPSWGLLRAQLEGCGSSAAERRVWQKTMLLRWHPDKFKQMLMRMGVQLQQGIEEGVMRRVTEISAFINSRA